MILVAAERARDFPQKPVYLIGTGESVETPMFSQMEDFTPRARSVSTAPRPLPRPASPIMIPLNTNGGRLSYMHSGMYALQESVRQMRGTTPAQIESARVSVCHGVGGIFAASDTIIMSNEPP